jgi:hypothetical protein
MRPATISLLLLGAVLAAGCGDDNPLADPTVRNTVDTVGLGSVFGSDILTPSGYSVAASATVGIDSIGTADFIYLVDTVAGTARHLFVPRGGLGLPSVGAEPGLLATDAEFDAVREARSSGYVTDDSVAIAPGDVFLLRSQGNACGSLGISQYGKLGILEIADSGVTFQVLTNNNCGYRGLEPGLPER